MLGSDDLGLGGLVEGNGYPPVLTNTVRQASEVLSSITWKHTCVFIHSMHIHQVSVVCQVLF